MKFTLVSGLSVLALSGCANSSLFEERVLEVDALARPESVLDRPKAASGKTDTTTGVTTTADGTTIIGGNGDSRDNDNDGPVPFAERSGVSRVPSIGDALTARDLSRGGDAPALPKGDINIAVPPASLPNFIDAVFGGLLDVPYVTGPGIANRSDVVQLRSSGEMAPETFLDLVGMALKDYGVRITAENGVFQILEDQALKARTPQFIKSRAKISTPANLRPVVQFVELNAIDANDMASILRQALGRNSDAVSIESASETNFIILSGLPGDIETALDIIYQMDELDYAGTQVQRYSPAFWNSKELQQEMRTLLEAEGWQASISASLPKTILMLSVDYSNDLMIFTRSREARARVNYWLKELDQPTPQGDIPQLFVYSVQNLDANLLAATVNQVLTGQGGAASVGRPSNVLSGQGIGAGGSFGSQGNINARGTANAGGNNEGLPSGGTRLVVDTIGNRLIYSGTASDYQRLLPLLRQLDTPPAEVLIEVTIADVSLNSGINFGVDWQINNLGDPDSNRRTGEREAGRDGAGAGLNLFDNPTSAIAGGGGGLVASIANNNFQASIDAAANNGDIRILSTPRIITRSGQGAQIQVGADVPVISSQGAANVDLGQGLLGLTSIDYRSTGILLSIEPIVYGNNRVDLTVSQELSNSSAGTVAGIPSPTFSNTSVSTALSLEDGATAVIGGLIQETADITTSGVPFLKDIPGLGNLFSTTSEDTSKREIVILITAYVLQGQKDKNAIVDEFTASFNRTTAASDLVTLRPRQF
ncbi:MAG: secretin N-terminal domain-containing protein [Pseudomonadota bacterium]